MGKETGTQNNEVKPARQRVRRTSVWKNGVITNVIEQRLEVVGPEGPDSPLELFDKNGQLIVKRDEIHQTNQSSGIDRSVPNGDR